MRRSSRLFEIIQLLRGASAPTTAQAIAEALEVNKRTIYRDIASLQAMRVPIEGEAGIGYVMRAGFDLPPLMFTADEIEAIVVGLSLLGRTSDTNLQTAAARIIGKLADVLPVGSDASLSGRSLQVSHWNAVPAASADYGIWSSGAPSAKMSAIGTRNTIDRNGVRYSGWTAPNQTGM